jgi:hypothetical protein
MVIRSIKGLVFVSILLSACTRYEPLTLYQFRPDCWTTTVFIDETGPTDTIRVRRDCPLVRGTDYKIIEPEWNYVKIN